MDDAAEQLLKAGDVYWGVGRIWKLLFRAHEALERFLG